MTSDTSKWVVHLKEPSLEGSIELEQFEANMDCLQKLTGLECSLDPANLGECIFHVPKDQEVSFVCFIQSATIYGIR